MLVTRNRLHINTIGFLNLNPDIFHPGYIFPTNKQTH